jgi:hypothetical protein
MNRTPANLPPVETRFKPGVSGNPGGQPKEKPFTDAYRKFSKMSIEKIKALNTDELTAAEAVAVGILREGIKGKPVAAQEAADRAEGKVKQTVEVEGGLADAFVVAAERLASARGRR